MQVGTRCSRATPRSAFIEANTPTFCITTRGPAPPIQRPAFAATASAEKRRDHGQ